MTATPLAPEPDTKNWTWVLDEDCPDCGFSVRGIHGRDVPAILRAGLPRWAAALERPDAGERPEPAVWSPLEYAAHVRDVCRIFAERVTRMLTEDDPAFANWDQDETALAERYWEQDPAVVSRELAERAEAIATLFEGVTEWERTGRRSDGAAFTVDSIARYFVHDYVHHLWDVRA